MVERLSVNSSPVPDTSTESLDTVIPPPLAFFKEDHIEKSNKALLDHEEQRWRLLGYWERRKLKRHVAQLARKLRRAGYNKLISKRYSLWVEYKQLRRTSYINAEAKQQAVSRARLIRSEAMSIKQQLDDLKDMHASYTNYRQWLDYERIHRHELKEDSKREKRIRKEMRQEAKWLEMLILDVYRKTPGCHYIYKDKKGNEINRTPRFSLSQDTTDAHYFWLSASKKTFLGWRWTLPYGVMISRLIEDDVLQNIKAATKREVTVHWSVSGQLLIRVSRLDSPDALPKLVKWRDAMRFRPDNDKLNYSGGVGIGRKFIWFDFESEPHILIGGKSGGGKSVFLNNIVASLMSVFPPSKLRFWMIDGKGGMEFGRYSDAPHLLGDIIKSVDEVLPMLEYINTVIRKRMDRLEATKAKDLRSYNNRVDEQERLPHLFLFVDEMSIFIGLGSKTERIHNAIMLLINLGRAVGLHLVLCTQHPEVKVVPGRIKTNAGRFSFAMPSVSASMIILDSPEAARLPLVPGRMVAVSGLRTLILQSPRIDDDDIENVISAAKQAYQDTRPELIEMTGTPMIKVWDAPRCLDFALNYLDGQLSGQKMHKMLGNESPGERHLANMFHQIRDQAASGVLESANGLPLQVKRTGKAFYAIPRSDRSVDMTPVPLAESASD
jgi:hypothetical protein